MRIKHYCTMFFTRYIQKLFLFAMSAIILSMPHSPWLYAHVAYMIVMAFIHIHAIPEYIIWIDIIAFIPLSIYNLMLYVIAKPGLTETLLITATTITVLLVIIFDYTYVRLSYDRSLIKDTKHINYDTIQCQGFDCPVCLQFKSKSYATPCQHKICIECMNKWTESKTTCPCCRVELSV